MIAILGHTVLASLMWHELYNQMSTNYNCTMYQNFTVQQKSTFTFFTNYNHQFF